MKRTLLFLVLLPMMIHPSFAQKVNSDSIAGTRVLNAGFSVGPQLFFLGGLDAGGYVNYECRPFQNKVSTLIGIDFRNKWFHVDVANSGLDTRSLKTVYSAHILGQTGLGYTFQNHSDETNTFYLTATPYFFTFKEQVKTPFIQNTVRSSSLNFNMGITWSNQKITSKGRRINMQFYLPIYGGPFLDELRTMSWRIGYSFWINCASGC